MTLVAGVLVNPIAGFGGALALHGTDQLPVALFDEAVQAGRAGLRMVRALASTSGVELVAAPGLLGSTQLTAAGIEHRIAGSPAPGARTDRDDTIAAARCLVTEGVEVLVFSGGDGTATDIGEAIGTRIPVIGVPSGVKMHSEVFSRSPEGAGRLLADFVGGHASTELAEVLDVGPNDRSALVGLLLAVRSREALQGAKDSTRSSNAAVQSRAIAHELIEGADPQTTWLVGPGATAGAVALALGFGATLRGVDVRHPSGAVECDVTEERLDRIVTEARHPRLVLGVVGGQGFLIGRGNQQISPRVIARLGAERIEIVATTEKVGGLFPPVLFVDADAPSPLVGYRRVRTGAQRTIVMRVVDAATSSIEIEVTAAR